MTDQGRRYLGLVAELKMLAITDPTYEPVLEELDRVWWTLEWVEREQIEGMLIALDRRVPVSRSA